MGDAMSKVTKKGRSKSREQFVMLTHDMLTSPAWESLSAQARAVLIQVAKRHNGRNNGMLGASVRDLALECRINKDTAARALGQLIDAGFLELCQAGSFDFKKRHAAEYRLTWHWCDKTGQKGSRAWKTKNATQEQLKAHHGLGARAIVG